MTIDMNAGYASIIQELFPQAEIIIDCFHIVQLISKCRIQVMNQLFKTNEEDQKKYRRLKKYFYLLFGQRTEADIIDKMVKYSPVLKGIYELYQRLIQAIINRNIKE